jgi:pimeloyl-ACP methyl ester carboxylesterase
MAEPTLFLFPGLGADGRVFARQQSLPYEIISPPWIEPEEDETLSEYTRRMAAGIDWPRRFVLGGVSFGGMVALEMARHLHPAGLVLIASRTVSRSRAVPLFVANALIQARPDRPVESVEDIPRRLREVYADFPDDEKLLFADMLAKEPVERMRRFARMVAPWRGVERIPCPRVVIHGADDKVIPPDLTEPDVLITGAGHLVNWTHADQVNQAIRSFVETLA